VWGSFVTAKPDPRDLDVLLIMNEDFEVERIALGTHEVFDSTRAKLRFESDVFWARASIGEEVLQTWLETIPDFHGLPENAVSWNWSQCDTD